MPLDTQNANPASANYRETFADLCGQLPPLPYEDPEARARRQQRAMDAVVALCPYDAFEAQLAIRVVAAGAHSADALRSAAQAVNDPMEVRHCRAQAASMGRQSDAALRSLLRLQARREKQEAEHALGEGRGMHPATMEQAGYWFRSVAVPPAPAGPAAPAPEPAAPDTPPPDDTEPTRTPARIDADADLYAIMYPDRAARIRAAGGLPAPLDFGPPEPAIVAALLRTRAATEPALETAPTP